MKTPKFFDRRVGSLFAAGAMLLGIVAPTVVPAFASAGTLTTRSIEATSSVAGATGVEYTVKFTPTATFKSIVIDWCAESPITGDSTCTTPTGFSSAAITAAFVTNSLGTVDDSASSAGQTVIKGTADGTASAVEMTLAGITNPTDVGSYYARIYTYNVADPLASTYWQAVDDLGTTRDTGSIALSTTNAIGVSAAVRETLTFCVANDSVAITAGCANASSNLPNLTLGEGTPKALVTGTVSTAGIYSQLSTNAASGAIVKMTNSTGCGGLKRVGESGNVCAIQPQGALAAMTTNQTDGKFGVRVGTPAGVAGNNFGTVTGDAAYADATNYAMDNTTSGNNVSSPYGDAVFSSTGPVSNINVPMTFAAVAGQTTPAGLYKANINLIATGTY